MPPGRRVQGRRSIAMPFLGADVAAQAFFADTFTPVIQQLLLQGFSLLSKKKLRL